MATQKNKPVQPDDTKYYRAKYWNPQHPEEQHVHVVFSGRNIMEAREYAKKISTETRQLWTLEEYDRPTDAMTY